MTRWATIPLLVLPAACGARGEPAPGAPLPADSAPSRPADSLALALPGGGGVWFAEGRAARDSSGAACYERTIEIRRDTTRVKVPLFYTRAAPTLLNDSSLRGVLYRDCVPMAVYRIHLRTGDPIRISDPAR